MTLPGLLAVLVILSAGIGLITTGVLLLRRRGDWLACGMGVVACIIAVTWWVALIVAWIHRMDPVPLLSSVLLAGVGLAVFAFWAIMLAECVAVEESNSLDKLVWVLVILGANIVGALIYSFVRRMRRPQDPPNRSRE